MPTDVVPLLCELVKRPSVNPMGRAVQGEIYLERRVTEFLAGWFERHGFAYITQELAPGRSNIVAKLEGNCERARGGGIILFEAHQDTVPVDGMEIDPWKAEVRDGKVFGRGACDVKGGMAAMLATMARVSQLPAHSRPMLVMACTVDEEFAAVRGVADVPKLWEAGLGFIPRVPDVAIVAEPTELNIVTAHKGALRWRCQTRGRAAHSSKPAEGDNAVYGMARVLIALERYAQEVVVQSSQHPRLGNPSLSVGLIHGGLSVNTVPDRCTIEIDRRLLPGDDPTKAQKQVMDYLRDQLGELDAKVHHDVPFLTSAPLNDNLNGALAARLGEVARKLGDYGASIAVNFGTDAPPIAACGVPTVVFGPGSIAQAHTSTEWIAVDQLTKATDILTDFVASWDLALLGLKSDSEDSGL